MSIALIVAGSRSGSFPNAGVVSPFVRYFATICSSRTIVCGPLDNERGGGLSTLSSRGFVVSTASTCGGQATSLGVGVTRVHAPMLAIKRIRTDFDNGYRVIRMLKERIGESQETRTAWRATVRFIAARLAQGAHTSRDSARQRPRGIR